MANASPEALVQWYLKEQDILATVYPSSENATMDLNLDESHDAAGQDVTFQSELARATAKRKLPFETHSSQDEEPIDQESDLITIDATRKL